jgi:hypothetical protein
MGRRWGKGHGGCREDAAFGVGLCGVEPEDEAEVPIGEQDLESLPFHYSEAPATMLPSSSARFCSAKVRL